MGWCGYGIYDGDDTQSRHHDYLKYLKVVSKKTEDDVYDWMSVNRTVIPKEKRHLLTDNAPLLIEKIKKEIKRWLVDDGEYSALAWQMALALYLDNRVRPPKEILERGIEGTNWLMGKHASEFNEPCKRRRALRNFLKRVERIGLPLAKKRKEAKKTEVSNRVKYRVASAFGLKDVGEIVEGRLLARGDMGDRAVLYFPKGKDGCSTIVMCKLDRRYKDEVWVEINEETWINLDSEKDGFFKKALTSLK